MLDQVILDSESATGASQRLPVKDGLQPVRLGPEVQAAALEARRAEARSFRLGMVVAVALHLGVLGIVTRTAPDEHVGTAGQSLDAISVEVMLVPAIAAEALPAAAPPSAPDDAEYAPLAPLSTGSISRSKPDSIREPDATAERIEPPVVAARPDPSPPDSDAPVLPVAEAPPPPKAEASPSPPPAAQSAAVDIALAPMPGQAPSRGAAAPSAGAIQAFARSVALALARTRPKSAPGAARGTVRIAFSVSDGGDLEDVRVAQSSGRAEIDQVALAAVRRATFPPPPKGLSLPQRTYEIPYHFR